MKHYWESVSAPAVGAERSRPSCNASNAARPDHAASVLKEFHWLPVRRQIGLASCSAVTNVLFCNDCQLHGLWSNGRRWFCSIAESTCAVRYGTSTQSLLGYRSFTAAADLTMFLLAGIYSLLCGVKIIKLNGTDWIVIHTTVENLLFSPTLRRISTTCLCLCIFFLF